MIYINIINFVKIFLHYITIMLQKPFYCTTDTRINNQNSSRSIKPIRMQCNDFKSYLQSTGFMWNTQKRYYY